MATIKSPLPGTFYRAPSPEADPYVSEGETVRAGDIVGLVEVMKLFHEITSDVDGVVTRFLVENEELVDVGQDIAELAG
jgi:acetyl-CoA carboxylase biotin carboxyl carrier protein